MVERPVGERELLGGGLDELDPAGEPLAGAREHPRALVDAGDAVPALEQTLATSPVPVATSSTCPRSAGRRETRNRLQRGSCPKERAAPTRS